MPKEMADKDALDILKSGVPWDEAAKKTKLPEARLKTLFADYLKSEQEKRDRAIRAFESLPAKA